MAVNTVGKAQRGDSMQESHDNQDLSALLAQVTAYAGQGECFRAYDLAMQGLDRWPKQLRLQHRAVLALCNAGALDLARARFQQFGLELSQDLDCLALDGRLHKSAAITKQGAARMQALRFAADAYQRAYDLAVRVVPEQAFYPGINLATTRYLLDRADPAVREIAQATADSLTDRLATDGAAEQYWWWATAIEAALLLDDADTVQALLPKAIAASAGNLLARASSVRQFRAILAAKGQTETLIAALVPPPIWHYTGQLPNTAGRARGVQAGDEARIVALLSEQIASSTVGGAYGALAAGADIVIAEVLLQQGVPLHVVLPFAVDAFLATSVAPFGSTWVSRFHACLDAASSVRLLTDDGYLGDDALFSHASQMAMGLAVLAAAQLSTEARQIAVWDGLDGGLDVGTAADVRSWQALTRPQRIIAIAPPETGQRERPPSTTRETKRLTRAMLFGDLKGFSKLRDEQIPSFSRHVLAPLGDVIDRFRARLDLVNTWGDGLFLVFSEVSDAAASALALQSAMADIDMEAAGLPSSLALRIGLHLGPAYCLQDPIQHRPNFFGAHVSRAARIEPVTPEGCVYVTEPVAAALALDPEQPFACDYVGMTEAAKSMGPMRMFLLRASRGVEQ